MLVRALAIAATIAALIIYVAIQLWDVIYL